MNTKPKTLAESLRPILRGFRHISESDKKAYLDYVRLVIERQRNGRDKNTLLRFKAKLENEIIN